MKGLQLLIAAVLLALMTACTTVPITERQQLSLIPQSTILATSFQQYDQFIKENELSQNQKLTRMVKKVGDDIRLAVEEYFRKEGMEDQLKDYKWEFHLVKGDQENAFAMPGGKVVVYEGIMKIAKDENGLATIMGHEVAHAVAGHGNERMSQQLATQLGGLGLAVALSQKPAETQQLWMAAFGLGSQVGFLLPYSRLHESEADRLGLVFMAMAGYDPNEAVGFWERMAARDKSKAPPEFLSTHPANETRIAQIREWMPEAMAVYEKSNGSAG